MDERTNTKTKQITMQTIAQQLGIKKFPFEIKDDNGNEIYWETSDGFWYKQEYDEKGNPIYYETSDGKVIDKRPKCENKMVEVTMAQQTVVDYLVNLYYTQYNVLLTSEDYEQAKAMEKEQIKDAFVECWKANVPEGVECKLDAEQYYNETFKSE